MIYHFIKPLRALSLMEVRSSALPYSFFLPPMENSFGGTMGLKVSLGRILTYLTTSSFLPTKTFEKGSCASFLKVLNSILTTFLLAMGVLSCCFFFIILSLCLFISLIFLISLPTVFIFFSSLTIAKEQWGVQTQYSVQEQPLHPPFRLKQIISLVSRSTYLISTLKLSSSQISLISSLEVKNLMSQPLINLEGMQSRWVGFLRQKQRLFQNSRFAFPLKVSVNCLRTGFKPLMYFFRRPSTSKCSRLANLLSSFSQSSRVPAICALTMPHPPPARVQSKYFLQVFMTNAVEKILSKKPVLVKLHSSSSTTPFTVFFLIQTMTPFIKGTQSLRFLSVWTTSSFLPSCRTKAWRSSSALSSTYLVNQSIIVIQISSGFILMSPCSMQALQKLMKKPFSAWLVNLAFSIQVKIRVSSFSFQRSLPSALDEALFGVFLGSCWMGTVLYPLYNSLNSTSVLLVWLFFLSSSCSHTLSRKDITQQFYCESTKSQFNLQLIKTNPSPIPQVIIHISCLRDNLKEGLRV